jgi:hypothetical protein
VIAMSGRNSKPDNNGPASQPSRLDQYGDKLADDTAEQRADACDNTKSRNRK